MEALTVNGKNYIKASAAARDLGYTADYVGQLCRSGRVDAMLVGRSWYVCKDSITGHKSTRYRSSQAKTRDSLKETLVRTHVPAKAIPAPAYGTDETELIPLVKKTGFIDVGLADALPVKVRSTTQKYSFTTTELPDIRFKGALTVTDIEDDEGEPVAAEEKEVLAIHHLPLVSGSKKPKNIDISSVPVRIIKTDISLKKRTVLQSNPSASAAPVQEPAVVIEEVVVERNIFGPVISFVSFSLASAVVLCLLGLESHISATAESLTVSYSFTIDHLTASAYSSIEHSQNFLYLVEFSTNVLIF